LLYAILAILMFGLLIAVHEFGHFITAKLSGVRVNEFSIGMGPLLWKYTGKETEYSLRLFPVGGFCAMEGEDEDSDDPKAFGNQGFWRKILILTAGAAMNFLAGFLLILLLLSQNTSFVVPVVSDLYDGFPLEGEQGLMVGDRICSINGSAIFTYSDMVMFLDREAGAPMDVEVLRGGKKMLLEDLPLEKREYVIDGQTYYKFGIVASIEKATPLVILRESAYNALDFARMVWISLGDLVGGRAGIQDMSGPIGIVGAVTEAGQEAESTGGLAAGVRSVVYFIAFIAINLAVMNLLPIPALDGGRILFLVVSVLFMGITRRKLDPKYEGYVHTVGFVLLLGLMAVVAFHDVFRIMR